MNPLDVFLTSRTRPNNESYDGGGAIKKKQKKNKNTSVERLAILLTITIYWQITVRIIGFLIRGRRL